MAVKFVPATIEHCHMMAPHMKKEDVEEIAASGGESPLDALLFSVQSSSKAYSMLVDDRVIAMSGVAPTPSGIGIPWLLTTEEIRRYAKTFLKQSKLNVQEMLEDYTMLINYVDSRHTVAKNWLTWLGFKIEEPELMEHTTVPFHRFTLMRAE